MKYWVLKVPETGLYLVNGQYTDKVEQATKHYVLADAETVKKNYAEPTTYWRESVTAEIVEVDVKIKNNPTDEQQLRSYVKVLRDTVSRQKHELHRLDTLLCERKRQLDVMGYVWSHRRAKTDIPDETYQELVQFVLNVGAAKGIHGRNMKFPADEQMLEGIKQAWETTSAFRTRMLLCHRAARRWKKLAKKYRKERAR